MSQSTESSIAYIPMDRRQAMATGQDLLDRTSGAALFADVSGFTPLTEALVGELGPRRGAEELTRHLNAVYGALIAEVHRYRGSVVSFAGDAITCWFDGDEGRRATACALSMQQVMAPFADQRTRSGTVVSLAIKAAVTAGPVRRFLIGDPRIQILDVMAGSTLDRMARAEQHAAKHEVVVDLHVLARLAHKAHLVGWREDPETDTRFAVVDRLAQQTETSPLRSWAAVDLAEEQIQPWILPPVYERLSAGQERFLAELRLAVALFLKFGGIDYDRDDAAGSKLDAYVRWVQRVLARYEGHLLQLITGDKGSYLYAAFGAPLSYDDDPVRAVAAAMELRSPPPEMDYITDVQIGISQGQMRAGAYGGPARRTYGVLGDEVTVAARLMGTAKPGQILVSKRVADAAARSYRFELLGSVPLKGKTAPIPVYLPLGRRALSSQRPATIFKSTLVGRRGELARMGQVLESALGAKGQILYVEGAAGVGKSHLAAEFIEQAIDRGWRVALGACQSTTQGIAYSPWRQAFRALFDLSDGAGQDEDLASYAQRQVAQVEATVRQANPDWRVRLPLLGDLLGLPIPDNEITASFDPRLRQESLFALVVEIVQSWAQAKPLLLLIEDALWMDEASLDLTVALGRAIVREPVLLTIVTRPPVRDGEQLLPELAQLPYYHLMDLNVLSTEGIEALVTNRLQGTPSALLLSLIEIQAQGNPLFIEELVDALRESEGLRRQNGSWKLSETLSAALQEANCLVKDAATGQWVVDREAQLSAANLGIPDSIHGIVLSRIDRLLERHKLTIKVASVIGRVFEFELLAGSHPLHSGRSELLDQIEVLEEREFTRLETPEPQLIYLFKHNITQEVVYQMLLEDQQRELHQAVGEALEHLLPDEVERLSYHFVHSSALDKALFYLDKAARKAQHEYANETALHYYSQALAFEERWQWRQGQVQVLHVLGRREEELEALRKLAVAPGAPVFEVAYLWGQYYEMLGDYAQAQAEVSRAIDACRDCGDVVGQVRCLSQLGRIARRQGNYERAKDEYGQALALLEGQDTYSDFEAQPLAEALNGLGTVHREQGEWRQAEECYQQALSVSRGSGDRQFEAQALNDLGGMAAYQRRFADALTYHRQALEIRRAIGHREGEGVSLYNLAINATEVGDYGQAQAYLSDALAIQQALGNRYEEGNVWNVMGGLYHAVGDLDMAESCLQQGLALCREIGDEGGQVYMLATLGVVVRDQGDLLMAEELLNDGLALAQKQDDKYAACYLLSHLGMASLQAGSVDQAIERASAALAMRQEMDLRLWTTADLATLAAAHLAAGDRTLAVEYAGQAQAILDECGGEGPEVPHRDYLLCYQVFSAAGQTERACTALQLAYNLVKTRANKIVDPALRRSFLERVPINRQIVQEAADRGLVR